MKKKLVHVLMYSGDVLAVCSSKARAREIAKMHVVDMNYAVDKFTFHEFPLER